MLSKPHMCSGLGCRVSGGAGYASRSGAGVCVGSTLESVRGCRRGWSRVLASTTLDAAPNYLPL